jgi:hypothetical protein
VEKLPNPLEKIECFCIRYANKIGGIVESQTIKKLNLSAPVDETVDLFIALMKLITISLTHHIRNKVMVRYRKNSIVNLQFEKPYRKEVVVKESLPMSDFNISSLPNGLRYWRWGGRGFCMGAEKTRSEENAYTSRRIPSVQCTLE